MCMVKDWPFAKMMEVAGRLNVIEAVAENQMKSWRGEAEDMCPMHIAVLLTLDWLQRRKEELGKIETIGTAIHDIADKISDGFIAAAHTGVEAERRQWLADLAEVEALTASTADDFLSLGAAMALAQLRERHTKAAASEREARTLNVELMEVRSNG